MFLRYYNSGDGDDVVKCDANEGFNYFEKVQPLAIQFKKVTWDRFEDKRGRAQRLDEGAPRSAQQKGYFKPPQPFKRDKSIFERQSVGYVSLSDVYVWPAIPATPAFEAVTPCS